MATLNIPDATYARLAARAAALNTTVEQLAAPVLDRLVSGDSGVNGHPAPAGDVSYDEWKNGFDELLALARSRANLYPPGFQADVSRESMYEGCGE